MKKRWLILMLILSLVMSLLACGGKTGGDTGDGANQTQAQMTWQDQYDLGIRLLNEGKYEDAILAFQEAIQIDPKKAEAYVSLAGAYVQSGDIAQALAILQEGMERSDDSQWIRDRATELGFGVDENGQLYDLSEEKALEESLSALPIQEKIQYYLDRDRRECQWIFEDNILLFGQDVTTISLEQLQSIAQQQGWVHRRLEIERLDEASCTYLKEPDSWQGLMYAHLDDEQQGAGLGFGSLNAGYCGPNRDYEYKTNTAITQLQYGSETGILDLKFGDSLEVTLIKLGIPNAEIIADLALQWPAEEGGSGQAAHLNIAPDYSLPAGQKNEEYVTMWYLEDWSQDQDAIEITLYVKEREGSRSGLTLYFFAPEYELWGYHILNY